MVTLRHPLHPPLRPRGDDAWGNGAFGADRGGRSHRGVDLLASAGDPVFAPIDGDIVRRARPYDDDDELDGLLLRGTGAWAGMEIKLFYIEPARCVGPVVAGDIIGRLQSLQRRYPGIPDHLHLEIIKDGRHVNPADWLTLEAV